MIEIKNNDIILSLNFDTKLTTLFNKNLNNITFRIYTNNNIIFQQHLGDVTSGLSWWFIPNDKSYLDMKTMPYCEILSDNRIIYRKSIKMEHFYEKIEGWFDFESIYKKMVENFDSGSHFVEIGSWLGRSASFMAVEILNSGKNIKFDCVDTWLGSKGSWDESYHNDAIKSLNKSLYEQFLENINPVINYINPIQGWSYEVVEQYKDNSLDFVFIDAAHDYESVKKDINAQYPKVKKGGVIAGHDYNEPWGVVQAVNEFFNEYIYIL